MEREQKSFNQAFHLIEAFFKSSPSGSLGGASSHPEKLFQFFFSFFGQVVPADALHSAFQALQHAQTGSFVNGLKAYKSLLSANSAQFLRRCDSNFF
jgi:hypothetical protein